MLGLDLAAREQLPTFELCAVITTHNRPEECGASIAALHEALRAAGLEERAFVLVLLDPSAADYGSVLDQLARHFAGRFALYEASRPLGKTGFWFTYQTAFDVVCRLAPHHVLFLQDDVTFETSLVREALAHWRAIEDPDKAVLYLCSLPDDEPNGRWIRFARRDVPGTGVRLTQWLDLQAFLAGRRFFECLRHEVFAVPASRWRNRPLRSSGVGEQFTSRLSGRANIYQVARTLVRHGELPSLMNPEARAQRPFAHGPGTR